MNIQIHCTSPYQWLKEVRIEPIQEKKRDASCFSEEEFEAIYSRSICHLKKLKASPLSPPTVKSLMEQFSKAWNCEKNDFDFSESPFDINRFTKLLSEHAAQFKKEGVCYETHFGYIEKFDLAPSDHPQLYIRADPHGDLKSPIENLRTLQEEGLLDDNFKCKLGVHLIFLGDYCDRGAYGTQIIELLSCLKRENPQQVHLIRGNHEYSDMNFRYSDIDLRMKEVLNTPEARLALEKFYETMPLTSYFSIQGKKRNYIQCTHALFEITLDPSELLDRWESASSLLVPKERKLSQRVHRLAEDQDSKLYKSAQRIKQLAFFQKKFLDDSLTVYNWGDVDKNKTSLGNPGDREYDLGVKDIRHYLKLSTDDHDIEVLFRGHLHVLGHLNEEDVMITTLPVGADCPVNAKFDLPDVAYIVDLETWQKRAILRERGHDKTDKVTDPVPLTSSDL